MSVRFPIEESGCQYPRLTMKLPVKVRVSCKKIEFFISHHLVPPTRNMGGWKRVRSDKVDMPNFLTSDLDLYPPPIPQTSLYGEVANREGSQIGNLPLPFRHHENKIQQKPHPADIFGHINGE